MNGELGEPQLVGRIEEFRLKLQEFNRQTDNFVGIAVTRYNRWLEDEDEEGMLARAIKAAWEERGITSKDRDYFFSIWYKREDLDESNIDFALQFLEHLRTMHQQLQDGKYLNHRFDIPTLNN